MYKTFTILATIMILASCGKEVESSEETEEEIEFTSYMPDIPISIGLDLDEDGTSDFTIEYFQALIFSSTSTMGIYCRLSAIGDNLVLHKEEEKNLFLRNLDDIKDEVQSPLFWNDQGWTENIISIVNNIEGEWPTLWSIQSDEDHKSYFLGLKLIVGSSSQVGWLEIEIDRENGQLSIVDKGVL